MDYTRVLNILIHLLSILCIILVQFVKADRKGWFANFLDVLYGQKQLNEIKYIVDSKGIIQGGINVIRIAMLNLVKRYEHDIRIMPLDLRTDRSCGVGSELSERDAIRMQLNQQQRESEETHPKHTRNKSDDLKFDELSIKKQDSTQLALHQSTVATFQVK